MRSVAILALLVAVPWTGVGGAARTDAPAQEADLLRQITRDEIQLPPGAARVWTVRSEGPPLQLAASAARGLEPAAVTVPVAGADVLAFDARVAGSAVLRILVDGEEVGRVHRGARLVDLAVPTTATSVAWEFVPREAGDTVLLSLRGLHATTAPVLRNAPLFTSECGSPPTLELRFGFAAVVAGVRVVLGDEGREVETSLESSIVGIGREHTLVVRAPGLPAGTPQPLTILLTDARGETWTLVQQLVRVIRHEPLDVGPNGWVYDLTPTVRAFSPCLDAPMASASLLVDGLEVPLAFRTYQAEWTAPRELAFNETLAYTFTLRLRDGTVLEREGVLREGLDRMRFESPGLLLVYEEAWVGVNRGSVDQATFANALDPTGMTPIVTTLEAPLGFHVPRPVLRPVTLEAIYAPHEIGCADLPVQACQPYAGTAPGYGRVAALNSELRVHHEGGAITRHAGFGQLTAAARLSALSPTLDRLAGAAAGGEPSLGDEAGG